MPGSSTPLLETTAGTDGRWSLTPGTPLAVGCEHLDRHGERCGGKYLQPRPDLVLVIDTAGPAAPSVQLQAASDSGVLGDFITNDRSTPTLVGTGAGPRRRSRRAAGRCDAATTTVGANGTWTLTPTSQLATSVDFHLP